METALLSRVCGRKLIEAVGSAARNGWDVRCFRLRFVWNQRSGRLGPNLCHVVLAWEGTSGDRATARRCLCGAVENPAYDQG